MLYGAETWSPTIPSQLAPMSKVFHDNFAKTVCLTHARRHYARANDTHTHTITPTSRPLSRRPRLVHAPRRKTTTVPPTPIQNRARHSTRPHTMPTVSFPTCRHHHGRHNTVKRHSPQNWTNFRNPHHRTPPSLASPLGHGRRSPPDTARSGKRQRHNHTHQRPAWWAGGHTSHHAINHGQRHRSRYPAFRVRHWLCRQRGTTMFDGYPRHEPKHENETTPTRPHIRPFVCGISQHDTAARQCARHTQHHAINPTPRHHAHAPPFRVRYRPCGRRRALRGAHASQRHYLQTTPARPLACGIGLFGTGARQ